LIGFLILPLSPNISYCGENFSYTDEWRYSSIVISVSALVGGEWSASQAGPFVPAESIPVPIEKKWALKSVRRFWRREFLTFPCRESNHDPSVA
jgi:hypothetical protein